MLLHILLWQQESRGAHAREDFQKEMIKTGQPFSLFFKDKMLFQKRSKFISKDCGRIQTKGKGILMSDEFLLSLYRFDPEKDERPYMSDYKISYPETGNMMVIDAIRHASQEKIQQ